MPKVISIQGSNGSGKTTIVYNILNNFPNKPIYGVSGPRYPEAYQVDLGLGKSLYVLGSYHTVAGGTDWISDFTILNALLDKYMTRGHVLFEGLITSGVRGRIGEKLEQLLGKDFAVLFIDTPVDVCIERVKKRRSTKGNTKEFDPGNLIKKHRAVIRTKNKYLEGGLITVIDVSSENGHKKILEFLSDSFDCPVCHAPGATNDGCAICGSGPAG